MWTKFEKLFWPLVVGLCVLALALPGLASEKKVVTDKVATVNGAVISNKDFDLEFLGAKQRSMRQGQTPNDSQLMALKKEILEKLIDRELLYQAAVKNGTKVEETTIDEQMAQIKKRFPSEDKFKDMLKGMKLTESELRSQLKKNLAIKQFVEKQFEQDAKVSDKETRAYYDNNQGAFKQPEQVKASHILIKVAPGAKKEEKAAARKKIMTVQERLKKGEDFAVVAKEVSEGPSGSRGGDLGYFGRGQMVKPFEEVVFVLKPGEVSDIVETDFGYHLIKSVDKKPGGTIAYKDVKDRLSQYLSQQKVRKEVTSTIKELKAKAKVERFLPLNPK
jgi:peptidyl-prolyl cis-trans isomerase C